MDYNTLIVSVLGYLLGAGGLIFWFLERKKFNAEVSEKLEGVNAHKIENDVKLSNHYRELLDDLKKRYEEELQAFIRLTNTKEKALKEEIAILKRRLLIMKTENMELKKRIKELESRTR